MNISFLIGCGLCSTCLFYLIQNKSGSLMDQNTTTNDSTDSFFRYLPSRTHSHISPVFSIHNTSSDHPHLQRIIHIRALNTTTFNLYRLLPDGVIDSYAQNLLYESFSSDRVYMRGLSRVSSSASGCDFVLDTQLRYMNDTIMRKDSKICYDIMSQI